MNVLEKSNQFNKTPLQQIADIETEQMLDTDLKIIVKKYTNYTDKSDISEPGIKQLLREKDVLINELKNQIKIEKQKNTDLGISYNVKLENLKTEHKKELLRLHTEYVNFANDK